MRRAFHRHRKDIFIPFRFKLVPILGHLDDTIPSITTLYTFLARRVRRIILFYIDKVIIIDFRLFPFLFLLIIIMANEIIFSCLFFAL